MSAIWDEFLTERDKQVFEAAGYGQAGGFGMRPALVIIDVNYDFVGEKPLPILESIKSWRNSSGEEGWAAVHQTRRILTAARAKGLPVFYSNIQRRPDNWDSGGWKWKNSRNAEQASTSTGPRKGSEIPTEIAPLPNEFVIWKQRPSIFFGTTAITHMLELQIDSLLFCGGTTSGCVRAAVVDAFSYNLRCAVLEEACFDRSQASHAINLFDMNAKYADVVKVDAAIQYVESLPEGLFPNRPKG